MSSVKAAWLQRKFKKIVLNLNWRELTWIDSKDQLGYLAQGKIKRFALNTIKLNIRGDRPTYIRTELEKSRTAIFFKFSLVSSPITVDWNQTSVSYWLSVAKHAFIPLGAGNIENLLLETAESSSLENKLMFSNRQSIRHRSLV